MGRLPEVTPEGKYFLLLDCTDYHINNVANWVKAFVIRPIKYTLHIHIPLPCTLHHLDVWLYINSNFVPFVIMAVTDFKSIATVKFYLCHDSYWTVSIIYAGNVKGESQLERTPFASKIICLLIFSMASERRTWTFEMHPTGLRVASMLDE